MNTIQSRLVLLFVVLVANPCIGQWRRIADFGSQVVSIYFHYAPVVPLEGFVGTKDFNVWRTMDGGDSWKKCFYTGNNTAHSITFKNKFEGWFCGLPGKIYRTLDGGDIWVELSEEASSIFFVVATNLLLGGSLKCSYVSSSDGVNFINNNLLNTAVTLNVVFSDGLHGIISPSGGIDNVIITSDGGFTWREVQVDGDLYQPVGIKSSLDFFAIREGGAKGNTGEFLHSSDGGSSWAVTYIYRDQTLLSVTGSVQYGRNLTLFFQTTFDNSEGIMMSEDTGKTFMSICGPINDYDTKFFVRDTFIYAADKYGGLWLNTTGIGSNSTPILSDTVIAMYPKNCNTVDTVIRFTLFDSCSGKQAKLLSTSITGSNRFSVVSGGEARQIIPNDSLNVRFNPSTVDIVDTAHLHLRFKLGWKQFDTTITFIGSSKNPKEDVSFTPRFAEQDVTAGGVTNLVIEPSSAVTGKGLSEIEMSVSYNGDILERVAESTLIPNATIAVTGETITSGTTTTTLRITGSDLSLAPSQAAANIRFRTYLSDTTITPVTVTTKLNPQDSNYERCTLSANTSDTNFALTLLCGDSLLSRHLGGKPILTIISVKPNPARDEVTVEFEQSENGDMTIEIYDMLGTSVHRVVTHSAKGQNTKTLHLADLPSGSYILTLRTPSGTSSKLFTKER